MRPGDTLLEALLALKALEPRISVNEIMAFLYTCETEGRSLRDRLDTMIRRAVTIAT